MELPVKRPEKIKLNEINRYLSCYLCKGYLIDATTISECLHSFCRSCIIKFLEENSYCPVCEVIINKAKPNLKLDKTLQDIVYKLVPELFVKEMTRRKIFYQQYPQLATRVSPEERGEDTERTIFSPQEKISLSLEYICDDSAPGAIRIPGIATDPDALKDGCLGDETPESLMKRYLLCPGMCRIDVLKKFVRNKYSVDTSQFYIDILYKRVPLPDHYTLIDIAYIYSWQRNETMKFFFRITDINKAPKRFDYFDASQTVPEFLPKPLTRSRNSPLKRRSATAKVGGGIRPGAEMTVTAAVKVEVKSECDIERKKISDDNNCDSNASESGESATIKTEPDNKPTTETDDVSDKKAIDKPDSVVPSETKDEPVPTTGDITKGDVKQQPLDNTYTKITLNRTNNVEIVTKVQPASDKQNQQSAARRVVKQTLTRPAKGPNKAGKISIPKLVLSKKLPKPKLEAPDIDDEKSRFFKSIELTAKASTPPNTIKKRKSSSPIKADKAKRPVKIILQEKPRDSGLQSLIDSCKINIPSSLSITIKESSEENAKPPVAPPVKNYIEILKLPDENSSGCDEKSAKLDMSKFCDSDSEQKVDQDLSEIAKSLTEKIPMSTTISHIVGPKQQFPIPVKMPPVQPAAVPELSKALESTKDSKPPQTFQKIFEESIKKAPEGDQIATPNGGNKRSLVEIATRLFKKSKTEPTKTATEALPKVAIPRLPHQRTFRMQGSAKLVPQTVASLHSTSLGMNYTVSVGQTSPTKTSKVNGTVSPAKAESVPKIPECKASASPLNEPKTVKTEFKVPTPSLGSAKLPDSVSPKHSPKSSPVVKHMYAPVNQKLNRFANISPKLPNPPSKSPSPSKSNSPPTSSSNPLSPNEILEKYNIQNLAQLTASLNFNPAVLALTAPSNQLAVFQHAMLLKHFELQNRQSWLARNQGPLLQYEKYLQSLNGAPGQQLMGNIKEN
ncbi:polycomb group protein Psc-like [Cylas formicarius]|uniref:polycomb group protein Psc-like n=1 Tax=Cylas formicarius TaxID=197179 RepID=UPI0029583779|nr:polycomb group protein Psc-like [Cylas formicarius]